MKTYLLSILNLLLTLTVVSCTPPGVYSPAQTLSFNWDSKNTPANIKFIFEETRREEKLVEYKPHITGAPTSKTYYLLARNLDNLISKLFAGVRVIESGDRRGNLAILGDHQVLIILSDFFKGESVEYAIVSEDQEIRAFTRIVPFPIESSGAGGCKLSAEMVTPQGDLFACLATGFKPNEQVTTVIDYFEGNPISDKGTASETGKLAWIIDFKDRNLTGSKARCTVSGAACTVSLDFNWGTAMERVKAAQWPPARSAQ